MKHKKHTPVFVASVVFFLLISDPGNGQDLKRTCYSSMGSSTLVKGIRIQQTIGQPYSTVGHYEDDISYHPGFLQSTSLRSEFIQSTFTLDLNIYPNPTSNSVTIESSELIGKAMITVTSMNGSTVYAKEYGNFSRQRIDCGNWSNGIYIIALTDDNHRSYTSKLIVDK